MRAFASVLTLFALAAPAAGAPVLSSPVACTLGEDCYIQQYMDHDFSADYSDFQCGPRSYNTHKGTDFAVPTVLDAKQGVAVVAAASGKVLGVRDGMKDAWDGKFDGDAIQGRECGNGLVIDHGDGWQTQYCHLREGSLAVSKGATVEVGAKLGQIGMSGRTEFPHLHLSVRKDGKPVDPFAPNGPVCDTPATDTLWDVVPVFQAGGILEIGFAEKIPEFIDVKLGTANDQITRTSPALVSYAFMFGARAGDTIEVSLKGPGDFDVQQTYDLEKNIARFYRAFGKKRRSAPWPGGIYETTVTMIRDGEVIDTKTGALEIPR